MGRIQVSSWVQRVGAWLFPADSVGRLVWVPPEWEPRGPVLEVVFGDWPAAGLSGPILALQEPRMMWRAGSFVGGLRADGRGESMDWRLSGIELAVSGAGRRAGFGAAWVVGLAQRVSPGRVFWRCAVDRRERVAAKLRRVAVEGERWRVDVLMG